VFGSAFVSTGHPCIIRTIILTVYNNVYIISIINTHRGIRIEIARGTCKGATAVDNRERHNLPVPGRCARRNRYAVTTTPQPPLFRKSHKVSYPTETTTHEGRVFLSLLKTPAAVAVDA